MVVRLGAAICGAAITFAYSDSAIIESTTPTVDSYAVDKAATSNSTRVGSPELQLNAAYRSWLAPLAVKGLEQNKRNAVASGTTIMGVASTYNPYKPGYRSGGTETASGEPYDQTAWAAAIQTDLRERFAGVRFGKDYQPRYALVESADKKAVIKINDVGPLKPGRVIDFNEQTMRYFDPTLQLGLIPSVRITPLLGDDWPTGPHRE